MSTWISIVLNNRTERANLRRWIRYDPWKPHFERCFKLWIPTCRWSRCPWRLGPATVGGRQTDKVWSDSYSTKGLKPNQSCSMQHIWCTLLHINHSLVSQCTSKSMKSNHPIRNPFGLDACSPFFPGCVSSTLTVYHPRGRMDNTKEALIRFLCLSSR